MVNKVNAALTSAILFTISFELAAVPVASILRAKDHKGIYFCGVISGIAFGVALSRFIIWLVERKPTHPSADKGAEDGA